MQTTEIPPGILFKNIIKEEIIDELVNKYNIPEKIAINYIAKDKSSLLFKTIGSMWDAQVQELENWVESTDIRLHQKEE